MRDGNYTRPSPLLHEKPRRGERNLAKVLLREIIIN
jgi:hypothetical protein